MILVSLPQFLANSAQLSENVKAPFDVFSVSKRQFPVGEGHMATALSRQQIRCQLCACFGNHPWALLLVIWRARDQTGAPSAFRDMDYQRPFGPIRRLGKE